MNKKTARALGGKGRSSQENARAAVSAGGQRRRSSAATEDLRTDLDASTLRRAILDNLTYGQGVLPWLATRNDWYMAVALTVRDRLLHRWARTVGTYFERDVKVVAYLSAEFLPGPHLGNNLAHLGIEEAARQAVAELGLDLGALLEQEEDPGLGNGGLGRLAACYLDSLATLEIPAIGYGIRYEFGLFDQEIRDGWQVETTDKWLRCGNPWEIARPEISCEVQLGGHTEPYVDERGRYRVRWVPERVVNGVPYDTPIPGYRVGTCNTLRLWRAEACESFDFQAFNVGDYYRAVDEKIVSETLTKVLYPNDEPEIGKRLRLAQQYFFVSCSLRDMLRILDIGGMPVDRLAEQFAIQLNDTHPSIAIAELMRLLVDERLLDWEPAWNITQRTFGYTNHTLLPEALETWPLSLFGWLLPRHLEIVYEINRRFLDDVRVRYPGDEARAARLSLVDDHGEKHIRMAHLACVGSHAINGVSALHTDLLRQSVLRDFADLWPERFSNKTNGVTQRRFLAQANPELNALLTEHLGSGWVTSLDELRRLEPMADDAEFRQRWRHMKRRCKERLAAHVATTTGVELDPDWLFDIQAKRIHEYKRQHLNVLHIVTLYQRLKQGLGLDAPPRAFLFAGKAAPGYAMAKRIIKLINAVAETVNGDPEVARHMKVAFIPNFGVKNAHLVYPAADLSEQVSLAGKEASGTGNMKFAMNGALTIGTLDGANVEIREEVGAENFFVFGLTADEVRAAKERGYRPRDVYESNASLKAAVDLLTTGILSRSDRELFRPLADALLDRDEYMLLADYQSYVECQEEVSRRYADAERWTRMSILNVARIGKFSSDRAIREYCTDTWQVSPVPVSVDVRGPETHED
ncbi:MAG: glycogen/starch/alpha-glucan phosphorylase [Candidatus Binatia bacterium]